jgi:predicted phage tail protein
MSMTGSEHAAPSAIDRIRLDPALRTRDDSGVWAVTIGTIIFALAAIVIAVTNGNERLLHISVAGAGLGACGIVIVVARHRRHNSRPMR